ncbi:hypothetical protein [Variovorax boronicumulans]|uniref:hypothetical protein n=1 Tax=Variovorax boronicumulans TaxID=436515 RepID=UPI003392E3E0
MNNPDIFPEEWRVVKDAENSLLVSRFNFKRHADFKKFMLLALSTISEQAAALRFLKEDAPGLSNLELAEIAPVILDIAVDGSIDNLIIARAVLLQYSSHFLDSRTVVENSLDNQIHRYLASGDEFLYRRLAELLVTLDLPNALEKLMLVCKNNENPDIAEIYRDFIKFNRLGKLCEASD